MAHYSQVLFDRSIRRRHKKTSRFVNETFTTQAAASLRERRWRAAGADNTGLSSWGGTFYAWARSPVERLAVPRDTAMPRDLDEVKRIFDLISWPPRRRRRSCPEWRAMLEKRRLFTVHTHYLRRRAWRYFRNIGKSAPQPLCCRGADGFEAL